MTDRRSDTWEGIGAGDLAARWGVSAVHLFETVGSTNDVARRLPAAEHDEPMVVLAEEQVAGRGRAGRTWVSPRGLGLWFSITARRVEDAGATILLPLRVGLAVAGALDDFLPPPGVGIKWPNDLWIGQGKLGGILCETTWQGDRSGPVIVGVGLNLLHQPADFSEHILQGAISVAMASRGPVARLPLADRVIPAVLGAARSESHIDDQALATRDLLHGRHVIISDPLTGRSLLQGVAQGIRPDGALVVRDLSGTEHPVRSGSVRVSAG